MESSPVSADLVIKLEFELGQLRQLLAESQELLDSAVVETPTATNRWAIGAILHAFYNGVENCLKRIVAEYDGSALKDSHWHIDLLTRMSQPTPSRNAVISEKLFPVLKDYLAFRHIFRNIYTHELRWDSMAQLVAGLKSTFQLVETEIGQFIHSVQ
jgi:hypothetical protein